MKQERLYISVIVIAVILLVFGVYGHYSSNASVSKSPPIFGDGPSGFGGGPPSLGDAVHSCDENWVRGTCCAVDPNVPGEPPTWQWCSTSDCWYRYDDPDHCGSQGICGDRCRNNEGCQLGEDGENYECQCLEEGEEICSGSCVDIGEDRSNCGSCGNSCEYLDVCVEGLCCTREYDPEQGDWVIDCPDAEPEIELR